MMLSPIETGKTKSVNGRKRSSIFKATDFCGILSSNIQRAANTQV